MEYLHGQPAKRPIVICIPVNLRPYFDSMTTRNFFAMVSASFLPEQENMTLDEVVRIVKESLRSQINKEHLEEIFSYNVSNQKNILLRSVPIFIKAIAMRLVYISSARASTSTITNLGKIAIDEKYQKYIDDNKKETFEKAKPVTREDLIKFLKEARKDYTDEELEFVKNKFNELSEEKISPKL